MLTAPSTLLTQPVSLLTILYHFAAHAPAQQYYSSHLSRTSSIGGGPSSLAGYAAGYGPGADGSARMGSRAGSIGGFSRSRLSMLGGDDDYWRIEEEQQQQQQYYEKPSRHRDHDESGSDSDDGDDLASLCSNNLRHFNRLRRRESLQNMGVDVLSPAGNSHTAANLIHIQRIQVWLSEMPPVRKLGAIVEPYIEPDNDPVLKGPLTPTRFAGAATAVSVDNV